MVDGQEELCFMSRVTNLGALWTKYMYALWRSILSLFCSMTCLACSSWLSFFGRWCSCGSWWGIALKRDGLHWLYQLPLDSVNDLMWTEGGGRKGTCVVQTWELCMEVVISHTLSSCYIVFPACSRTACCWVPTPCTPLVPRAILVAAWECNSSSWPDCLWTTIRLISPISLA